MNCFSILNFDKENPPIRKCKEISHSGEYHTCKSPPAVSPGIRLCPATQYLLEALP